MSHGIVTRIVQVVRPLVYVFRPNLEFFRPLITIFDVSHAIRNQNAHDLLYGKIADVLRNNEIDHVIDIRQIIAA